MAKNSSKNKIKILSQRCSKTGVQAGRPVKSALFNEKPLSKEVLFQKSARVSLRGGGGGEPFHSSAALQTEVSFNSFEQNQQIEEFQKNLLALEDKVSKLNFMMREVEEAFSLSKSR